MRGRRGRPPKTLLMQEPSPGPVRGLRPRKGLKGKGRGCSDDDFVTPKRGNPHSSRGKRKAGSAASRGRGRGRGAGRGRGRRSAASAVVYDDHESDEDEDAVSLASEEDEFVEEEPLTEEEDEVVDNESDYLDELPEDDDDDASYCTESSHGSTPGRRRRRARRPPSPVLEQKEIPPLELPKSSEDLLIPPEQLLNASAVYEVLRTFSTVLRLSPFRFEDFCAAVAGQEQCALLAETHIALLKAILREEDSSNTTFGPADLKDSVNSTLYFVDGMTWPEVVRAYCESEAEYGGAALEHLEAEEYPYGPLESKVKVLQFLVDRFLTTNMAREELMSEGAVQYDDHCRACHRLGDLLCCETCSAVYHLECVRPPLEAVPEDEWQCEICVAHRVPGVSDCVTEAQRSRPYLRQEPIGYDRHQRKYWFLNRRVIVEEDGEEEGKKIWYYSTKVQLGELIEVLDKEFWENDLCAMLEELKEEIHTHMDITEDLTNKARGNNKAYLTVANDEILERQKAHQEELDEAKRKAAEKDSLGSKVNEGSEGDNPASSIADLSSPRPDSEDGNSASDKLAADAPAPSASEESNGASGRPQADSSGPSKADPPSLSAAEDPGERVQKEWAEKSSESGCGGNGEPVLESEPPQIADENSCSSHFSVSECLRAPEEPDLADRSSQSSLNSQDDAGEGKGNGDGGKTGSATRMVTRLRNPDSKLSQRKVMQDKDASSQDSKALKETPLLSSLVRKDLGPKTGSSSGFFKLGQEGKFRVYHNQYSTNALALNKHQHREDHDKRRHLSHKFCMTPAGEFKWNGSVHGSKMLTVSTLRLTIIQLENNIPAPFLHPNWASHRSNWIKAVQMCSKAREFALALAILECAIKPVVMLPVWKDSLGHTRLHRMTAMEREEKEKVKKREKKLEDEETMQQATWVKYTFPIKHQVWKQKGEEYRVTGYGGWSWVSKTHVPRFVPRLPGNTNVNYRKALEAANTGKDSQTSCPEKSQNPIPETPKQHSSREEQTLKEEDEQKGEKMEVDEKAVAKSDELNINEASEKMDTSTPDITGPSEEKVMKCTASPLKNDQCVKGESIDCKESKVSAAVQPPASFEDVVNVSQGFQQRTAYKKKGKGSKLDGLLERRVKQFTLEERHRLEKLKQVAASKPATENGTKVQEKTSPSLNQELKTEGPSFQATKTVLSNKAANPMVKEKDPVVQKLEFDQDEPVMHGSSEQTENLDVRLGSNVKTEAAASLADKEPKVAPEPEHKTGNGTLLTDAELNGGSRKDLEGSLNLNSKMACLKFEGTEKKDTAKNSSSMGENGLSVETNLPVHVNGSDGSMDSPSTNLTNNINSKEMKQSEEEETKMLPSKDPVKSLMNGDLIQGSQNEKVQPNEETQMDKSDLEYLPSQKVARLDSNTEGIADSAISSTPSQLSPAETVKSDGLSSSTKVSPMETEEAKLKTLSPSPILSTEESSLSSDVAENSTNSGSGAKTIITEVTTTTTTTTTVSTESHVLEASSLPDGTTISKVPSTLTSAEPKVESSMSVSTLSTTTTTKVTKVTNPTLGAKVTEQSKTIVTATFTDAKSAPSSTSLTSVTLSKEISTRDRVRLLKFSRCKKTRSGTALPSYRKFVTKSSKKSIFVLPNDDLKKLARRAGIREVPVFNYNAKPAVDIWPYPSPRPTFGITWRYRLQTVRSLAGVSLMLRLLWACLRWDDMSVKPSAAVGTTRTETSDTEITTTEIIKRRDVGPYGIRSEYCIRKIICPLGVPEAPKETPTPQRKGLRSSALRPKKPEPSKQTGPVVIENWVPEEELELWEIRAFTERVEREKAQATDPTKVSVQKTAEEVKAQLEAQLKQQRLAAQQKRLEQQKTGGTTTQSNVSSTPTSTASSTQKVVVGSLTSPVTPATKVVLATKLGTPVQFQQGKNFQQSFASWVKQGQSNTGVVQVQQKVVGIIPSSTTATAQSYTSFQPRLGSVNIRPNTSTSTQQGTTTGTPLRPGMTVVRSPLQQATTLGKTIIRAPLMVQQGQGQQVVTQIIRGTPVSKAVSSGTPTQVVGSPPRPSTPGQPQTPQTPSSTRPQQGQVKLTLAQLTQLTQGAQGGNPGLTVVIQGQGQTTGQLQVIPQGVTVIPCPGQQLMQAAMPNGQVQRFLFTPMPPAPATPAPTVSAPSTSATPASSSPATTTTAAVPTMPTRPAIQPAAQFSPITQPSSLPSSPPSLSKPQPTLQPASTSQTTSAPVPTLQTQFSSAQALLQPQSQIQPQTQSQPQSQSQAQLHQTQPQAKTQPQLQSQLQQQPQIQTQPQLQAQLQYQVPSQPQSQLQIQSQQQLQPQPPQQAKLQPLQQLQPQQLTQAQPQFQTQQQLQSQLQQQPQPQVQLQPQQQPHPQAQLQPQQQLLPQKQLQPQIQLQPQQQPHPQAQLQPQQQAQLQPQQQAQLLPQPQAQLQPQQQPQPQAQLQPQQQPQPQAQLQPQQQPQPQEQLQPQEQPQPQALHLQKQTQPQLLLQSQQQLQPQQQSQLHLQPQQQSQLHLQPQQQLQPPLQSQQQLQPPLQSQQQLQPPLQSQQQLQPPLQSQQQLQPPLQSQQQLQPPLQSQQQLQPPLQSQQQLQPPLQPQQQLQPPLQPQQQLQPPLQPQQQLQPQLQPQQQLQPPLQSQQQLQPPLQSQQQLQPPLQSQQQLQPPLQSQQQLQPPLQSQQQLQPPLQSQQQLQPPLQSQQQLQPPLQSQQQLQPPLQSQQQLQPPLQSQQPLQPPLQSQQPLQPQPQSQPKPQLHPQLQHQIQQPQLLPQQPSRVQPQPQLQPQTQSHMPTQTPVQPTSPLPVSPVAQVTPPPTQVASIAVAPQVTQTTVTQVRPQIQLPAQLLNVPGIQQQVLSHIQNQVAQLQAQAQHGTLPQQIKLQLPIQIQQQGGGQVQTHQIQNVVTIQTASVQEQLQRIQQLRDQQQQKKKQQEAKREQAQQAASQSELLQKQVVMKQNAVIEHLKQKKAMTPAEREENQRMIVCNQVMKFILDKIDKDEKQAAKKRKREESVEQKRSKQNASKLSALLFKHKEQLKAEILKKRALLDKELQVEVQEELRKDLSKLRREKEKAQVAASQAAATAISVQAASLSTHFSTVTSPPSSHKRKRDEERDAALSKSKKKKMISTSSKDSKRDTKLYCVCKTPYDESKFYIGCDLCSNWYHGECVGITEKEAKKMDDYICMECKRAQEGSSEELYCICRTPYDESQFYIGCDRCQNWYHGRCVGILQSEATHIDEYVCPQCQSTEEAMTVLSPLTDKDYEGLKRILRSLQTHKMAWPFLEPVDPNDAPDYYGVIKEPMDLSTMEQRVQKRFYSKLTEFVADMTKIFDNCRYYNPSDSPFYQCAEFLESFFVQKLKAFKASRSHNNKLQSSAS
ncbi:nucleosome-remodeling factor subunit BPTF isoform X4 [Ictalurus punctatus]|uniref:Nucleosome-remodeling factor subunit BPTF isoform X4 n=1 Tax=Ictalurus punctatus TaxID=7998 RepID=A0A9F7TCZ8_ICTPU|nr:nucleosome-remodeling factor subunit BPTF isoform X4 [Ictalurus punctatus]